MKKLCTAMVILFVVMVSGLVMAQSNTGTEETILVKKSDLTQSQIMKAEAEQTTGGWIGIGKEIGIAVSDSLKAITTETSKFANTKLGTYIMILVAWKVMGQDFLQMLVGIPLWFIGSVIFTVSFFKSAIRKRVVSRVDKEGTKYFDYNMGVWEMLYIQLAHGGAFLLFCAVCGLITFA